MPKTIDILIGVSLVMLVVSLAVTVITQFLIAALNSRGRNLRAGLSKLLRQIDPTLEIRFARQIANGVLTHPLVGGAAGRKGGIVHREEFTKLLMDLGTGSTLGKLKQEARTALERLLNHNGINDPAGTLRSIRLTALALEKTNPELAEDARHSMAIIDHASSDLVAKVNSWFDRTIDRVAVRFTATTRAVTFLSAFAVAFAVQLDTFALINRLSVDDQLRTQLAAQAIKGINLEHRNSSGQTLADISRADVTQNLGQYLGNLAQFGVITIPRGRADYDGWPPKVPGILFSTLLLSLGAPFWYNTLSSLLRLRSALAEKDDVQRNARQSAAKASDKEAPANPAELPGGLLAANEQGNLDAV